MRYLGLNDRSFKKMLIKWVVKSGVSARNTRLSGHQLLVLYRLKWMRESSDLQLVSISSQPRRTVLKTSNEEDSRRGFILTDLHAYQGRKKVGWAYRQRYIANRGCLDLRTRQVRNVRRRLKPTWTILPAQFRVIVNVSFARFKFVSEKERLLMILQTRMMIR